MAGASLSMLPVLILYFLAQKQFVEGIATTGLKG
jgi:ABC-type glycerol-3-phosphate transport system permease component